jgi:hypothetical protein
MITKSTAEWMLLGQVYHHVLSQSPSPEFAKIEIAAARRNGQLRLRAELREHRARPGLRLAPGQKPPQHPPVVTSDYVIPSDTQFDSFDWERSRATRQDSTTKSLFEYVDIVLHRDDILARWPPAETDRWDWLTLKPGMWGVNVDLKELLRRVRRRLSQRNT